MPIRPLSLLLGVLTAWCLGCDAYESVAEWLPAPSSTVRGSSSTSMLTLGPGPTSRGD
jgi:hypothetical protein